MGLQTGLELLTQINLNNRVASLDLMTGKWGLTKTDALISSTRERTEKTVASVYERLKKINEIRLEKEPFRLLSQSSVLLDKYRQFVMTPMKREVRDHIRFVRAVHLRVNEHIKKKWQWFIDLPLIGYIYSVIVWRIRIQNNRSFKTLSQILESKYKELSHLEGKLEKALHVIAIMREDPLLKKAYKDVDQKRVEEALHNEERSYINQGAADASKSKILANRTFLFVRKDINNPEGFIVSTLKYRSEEQDEDCQEEETTPAIVEHIPFSVVQKESQRDSEVYSYSCPINLHNPAAGIVTYDTLKQFKQYLYDLVKSE